MTHDYKRERPDSRREGWNKSRGAGSAQRQCLECEEWKGRAAFPKGTDYCNTCRAALAEGTRIWED